MTHIEITCAIPCVIKCIILVRVGGGEEETGTGTGTVTRKMCYRTLGGVLPPAPPLPTNMSVRICRPPPSSPKKKSQGPD